MLFINSIQKFCKISRKTFRIKIALSKTGPAEMIVVRKLF